MAISFARFKEKLVNKVLFAESDRAAQRYIHAALKAMVHKKVHGFIVFRFIESVNRQLHHCKTPEMPLQQWINIRTATHELQYLNHCMRKQSLAVLFSCY